jgi:hypothetical protein
MKVAIGIPTFSRSHIVEMGAGPLSASWLASDTIVIVIDALTTEYEMILARREFCARHVLSPGQISDRSAMFQFGFHPRAEYRIAS